MSPSSCKDIWIINLEFATSVQFFNVVKPRVLIELNNSSLTNFYLQFYIFANQNKSTLGKQELNKMKNI